MNRRAFLRSSARSLAALGLLPFHAACADDNRVAPSPFEQLGELLAPNADGLMLPTGFSSRVVARSGETVAGSSYTWHGAPDGGAVFSSPDGGWIYVSNSELANGAGSVGALRFDAAANIVNAYSILSGTSRNCAGGATPWGSWLSCEETDSGRVWECDPFGNTTARPLPALGVFAHEAVCVDTDSGALYLTEDRIDGGFYRFIASSRDDRGYPLLDSGLLQIARLDENNTVTWLDVPEPDAEFEPTRYQVDNTPFEGGEGIVYLNGRVYFATKGDNRVWSYSTGDMRMRILYDADTHPTPILTGVDNIALGPQGELVVGEDGGDMQLVAITASGKLVPLAQLTGHPRSEMTGPAFTPDGRRLYFSSQRGSAGSSSTGMTFEVTGPFRTA